MQEVFDFGLSLKRRMGKMRWVIQFSSKQAASSNLPWCQLVVCADALSNLHVGWLNHPFFVVATAGEQQETPNDPKFVIFSKESNTEFRVPNRKNPHPTSCGHSPWYGDSKLDTNITWIVTKNSPMIPSSTFLVPFQPVRMKWSCGFWRVTDMKYRVFSCWCQYVLAQFWGTESQRGELGETLLQSIGALSSDENGTQVLQKALLHAPQKVGDGALGRWMGRVASFR